MSAIAFVTLHRLPTIHQCSANNAVLLFPTVLIVIIPGAMLVALHLSSTVQGCAIVRPAFI
jgi:hypothetical protein